MIRNPSIRYCIATAVLVAAACDSSPISATTYTAKPALTTSFANGSFEIPDIGAANIVQSPSGSSWTFSGQDTGFASNGSLLGLPDATDGDQKLYIQGAPREVSQTFHASSGRYRLTFRAAQHLNHSQSVAVAMDTNTLGVVTPPGNFFSYFSYELDLAAGSHTLYLRGQTAGQAAFFDDVRLDPIGYVAQGSFEQPVLPVPSIVQNPTRSAWAFGGAAGFATNGSTFGNPPAPAGTQVLYLVGDSASYATQSITTPAMRLRLSMKIAQRSGNNQTISVQIDGTEVGRVEPQDTQFTPFFFDAIALSAGTHTITLAGQTSGDQVAYIDDVQLMPVAASGLDWFSASSWVPAGVPSILDDVTIPTDAVILLSGTNAAAKSITVDGELHCSDANISLRTEWVMVMGRLICGSPTSPYLSEFVLTLIGEAETHDEMGMGSKFLGAMGSGVIEIHGEKRISKARLMGTATTGSTTLNIHGNLDWRPGDTLVLAPTRWITDAYGNKIDESETVKIASLTGEPPTTTVQLETPLQFTHYAGTSSYTNSTASTTWNLDESAHVGLLSRNIRIQGEVTPAKPQFGGHMMSMGTSFVRVSGTEFYQMGQLGRLGRYPFHWHLRNDAHGQYIVNSSVHKSFNRCITVHGTNYTHVADNVCYDFIGHGYFLEDGNEKHNTFDGNLGILARKPLNPPTAPNPPGILPMETDYRTALASNGPAVFWISHPDNRYINNIAAGSEGTGFWYHLERTPFGSDTVAPNVAPFGEFDNNEVYASRQGFSSCRDGGGLPGMESANVELNRLKVNHTGQGVWPCAHWWNRQNGTFNGLVIANTENGFQAPSPFDFVDSLFVAHTANTPPRAQIDKEVLWVGATMYDQGFVFDNVMFANYDQPNMSAFHTIRGAGKLVNNRTSGLSFENSPNRYRDLLEVDVLGESAELWSMPIHDADGTLVGAPGTAVPSHPMMYDASCLRAPAGIDGYACDYRYAQFRLDFSPAPGSEPAPFITQMRSDGVVDSSSGLTTRHLAPVIAGETYRYLYRFDAGIASNDLDLRLISAFPGDTSVHQILDVPASLQVIANALDYSTSSTPPVRLPWAAANSVGDLLTGAGHRYYHDTASASLYVKLLAEGDSWHATDFLRVCMTPLVDSACSATTREVVPPSVAITSPARIAKGPSRLTSVVVTGNVSHPAGIGQVALFVNDAQEANVVGNVSSFAHTLNLAVGSYILRLVATSSSGVTYTDLQHLTVGEPAARIEMLQPLRNGTYELGSTPNLSFVVENWSGSGKHAHWFHNGVDQGDASSGSVVLSDLVSGRHDIEIALANADHSVIGVNSRNTIYVTSAGVLADFEEGADRRSEFQPDTTRSGTVRPTYIFGLRATSALDNTAGDMNYFLTYADANSNALQSRYTLKLAPAQNWTPYSNLEILHYGMRFEVFLLTPGGRISLGLSANALPNWLSTTFPLPSPRPTGVQGIELIQYGPAPQLPNNCATSRYDPACSATRALNHIKLLP